MKVWVKRAKIYSNSASIPGGFNRFKELYSPLCPEQDDNSDSDNSIPDLGFDKLKIDTCIDLVGSETPLDNRYPVEILPYLFLGSKQDSENLELLSKLGIHRILNVTPNIPNCFESNGMKYMQIPIPDHWSQNLAKFFPEAIEFIGKISVLFWSIIGQAYCCSNF